MTPATRLARDIARASTVEECHAVAEKWLARLKKQAPAKTLPEPKRAERKAAKKESAKMRRALVRAACMTRANGCCECCGAPGTELAPLAMDHFFGRAYSESVATCWMLCRLCDHAKTENRPNAAQWRRIFALHQSNHGYEAAARSYR